MHTSIWDYLKDDNYFVSGQDLFTVQGNGYPTDFPVDLTNEECKIEIMRDEEKYAARAIVKVTPYSDQKYKNGSFYRQYFSSDTSWRGEWYSPIKDLRDSKADKFHTHDDRYYTEAEINNQMNNKANKNHQSSGGEYGTANQTAYGHVKTTDNYKAQTSDDIVLNTRGAYNMYNWVYSLIDDERYFRRFSTDKDQEFVTIRSTGKQAGNWPLMIGVGEMVVMFNCMTTGLSSTLSSTRNCWNVLVEPDTRIISRVQAMIEGNDHILVRVFLSSEWNNGYSGFVRSMNHQYPIASVGTS